MGFATPKLPAGQLLASLAAVKMVPRGVGVSLSGTSLLAEASLPPSTAFSAFHALLVPPKHTMLRPPARGKTTKIVPRGVSVSLSGTPLLAEAYLRGAQAERHFAERHLAPGRRLAARFLAERYLAAGRRPGYLLKMREWNGTCQL
jgi:hypothetical protein